MRIILALIAAVVGMVAALPASADTAVFNLTGAHTAQFSLPASPTSIIVMPNGDPNVFATETTATVDGVLHSVYLNFYLLDGGGGFDISILDGAGYYTPAGDQLFTGTLDAPTFTPGTYQLADYFIDGLNYQLTITTTGVAAVPEPATWATMMLGIGIAGAALRRRRASILIRLAVA